jgi:twitching motility two-component system response regulator PilG
MEGKLSQISVASIFLLIEREQKTGTLLINNQYHYHESNWFVFFNNGKIIHATNKNYQNLTRLKDYIYFYNIEIDIEELNLNPFINQTIPEYNIICELIIKQLLTTTQAKLILNLMIQEVMFDILNLRNGLFKFVDNCKFTPVIISYEQLILVKKTSKKIQKWQELYPYIRFPEECPVVNDSLITPINHNLCSWANGKTSLKQIARYLHQDILTIGKNLYSDVELGYLKMLPGEIISAKTKKEEISCVLYISKDTELLVELRHLSRKLDYQLIEINDYNESWQILSTLKPEIILGDFIDNGDWIAMARQCQALTQTKVIAVLQTENFLDKIELKSRGATDFLIKPWSKDSL